MDNTKVQILKEVSLTQQLSFEINTLSSEQQILALLNGEIDIGLIRPPVRHTLDGINTLKLYEEPLMVAVHIDHAKFAKSEKVYLKDLKDECFVSTPHAERGGLSYLVANLCLVRGFTPQKPPFSRVRFHSYSSWLRNLG